MAICYNYTEGILLCSNTYDEKLYNESIAAIFLFSWVVKGGAVEDCWGTAVIERADIPKL